MRTRMLLGLSLLLLLEGCSSSQQNGTLQGPIAATPGVTGNAPPVGPGHPLPMNPSQPMPGQPLTYGSNRVPPLGNPQATNFVANKPAGTMNPLNPGGPYGIPGRLPDGQVAIDPLLLQATMTGDNVKTPAAPKPAGEPIPGELRLVSGVGTNSVDPTRPDLMYVGPPKMVPPPPTMKDIKEAKEIKEPAPAPLPPLPMPAPTQAAPMPTEPAPSGAPVMRLVGTKKFNLSFAMQDAPLGSTVEVWATQDSKAWKRIQATFQPPSMLSVETPGDGMFALKLIVKTTAGPARTPKAGETPDCWISVDTTKPTVELFGVDLSLTSKTPALVVRWKASDRNFGPRPMTISYAETPEGPWIPLAASVTNEGRIEIPVVPSMPRKMLVRVEAADIAGNIGSAQTALPIKVDQPWPPSPTLTAELQPVSAPAPKPTPAPVPPPAPVEAPKPIPSISIIEIVPGN